MTTTSLRETYYRALVEKDPTYEGSFFVGVKSTGIFCRPTCPARKPKLENCEFYKSAQEALIAGFRPCLRCHPLSFPQEMPEPASTLLKAINKEPSRRWRERDIIEMGIDPSTARRQFQKRFGMTYVQYARAKRMGIAMNEIRLGRSVIEAQLTADYESGSGFRDAFSKIMGTVPGKADKGDTILKAAWLDTPLGPMIVVADEKELFLLEFIDRRALETEIRDLRRKLKAPIIPGITPPIISIENELKNYFEGHLKEFKTPIFLLGTPFQEEVWKELQCIPYGETCSYSTLASTLNRPSAFRAVANANGKNQLAIIIPCHRVINQNGELGGYGGGIQRKEWLINHEKRTCI